MSNLLDPPDQERRRSLNQDVRGSRFIIVMGVSGTGKSTLGAALSKALHLPFIDGDDLHPASNVSKMSRGEPLNDTDRQPWLEIIRKTATARILAQLGIDHGKDIESTEKPKTDKTDIDKTLTEYEQRPGVIMACSALKKKYRAVLRGESTTSSSTGSDSASGSEALLGLNAFSLPTYFVYLKGDRDVLMDRMQNRKGHFMKAEMLESQLNALESPEGEPGVVTVSVEVPTEEQVREVVEAFRSQGR